MTHLYHINQHSGPGEVTEVINSIVKMLLSHTPVNRNEWQGEVSTNDQLKTYEANNVLLTYCPTSLPELESHILGADRPWAEEHFQERISGKPLNPPPSAANWPWHQAAQNKHVSPTTGQFSHTYPERFWPKNAGIPMYSYSHSDGLSQEVINRGIRYGYGDLNSVIDQLRNRPFSRQAYLPIFFPEDTGAPLFQRVPCTLGYHFIRNGKFLDVNYFIRSCDMTRHFRNDIFFTVRLLQWVTKQVENEMGFPMIGQMTMFISNLHIFQGDVWRYES
jgi:hypothetical protein